MMVYCTVDNMIDSHVSMAWLSFVPLSSSYLGIGNGYVDIGVCGPTVCDNVLVLESCLFLVSLFVNQE